MMRILAAWLLIPLAVAHADEAFDLCVNGQLWLQTVTPEYAPRGREREETYKVFTHVYDFAGDGFLTKGSGGLYTHHRGLFIGWLSTSYGDQTVDSWHMRGCYQAHVEWVEQTSGDDRARQTQIVEWRDANDTAFLRETRTITAKPGENGIRIIDFESVLEATSAPVQLRGDSHHAGMQIRLSNEVSEHQETTVYILPESAEQREDDEVGNAWWAACSADIGGKRSTVIHMTPPDHATGAPVYSIRPYARFGAFFEPDVAVGTPLTVSFRIIAADTELDRAACQALYDAYASERLAAR